VKPGGRDFERSLALREARQAAAEALVDAEMTGLPICPFNACEKLGIAVIRDAELDEDVAGCTERIGNGFRIALSKDYHHDGQVAFTLAHEIGHCCIGSHSSLFLRGAHQCQANFRSRSIHERQADHFAAAFLMPEAACRKVLDAIPDDQAGLQAIELLRTTCGVSLTAAAIRYAELTSHVAAVVISSAGYVDYCVRSEPLCERIGQATIAHGDKAPAHTPTANFAVIPALVERAEKMDSGDIRWDMWFPVRDRGEVFEEAKGLGKYGKTLTVLTAND
jgi:Zn-dependent peptidase ImmA (M78 family)